MVCGRKPRLQSPFVLLLLPPSATEEDSSYIDGNVMGHNIRCPLFLTPLPGSMSPRRTTRLDASTHNTRTLRDSPISYIVSREPRR